MSQADNSGEQFRSVAARPRPIESTSGGVPGHQTEPEHGSANSTSEFRPFGSPSTLVKTLPTSKPIEMYFEKCGVDVSRFFEGRDEIHMYECSATGMRFWRPTSLAGDEPFYRELSEKWPNYYRSDRWEYADARSAITAPRSRVLEVGCGRGYFLRSLEPLGHMAVGIELNNEAIASKITTFDVRNQSLESMADAEPDSFDVVCSFQVLEHVTDPAEFIRDCVKAVRPGGVIILSTPNYQNPVHANGLDSFDLPPHHLNHFCPSTYARIARLMDLELVRTRAQIDEFPRARVSVNKEQSLPARVLRRGLNRFLRAALGTDGVPGHTLMAVFRRPD